MAQSRRIIWLIVALASALVITGTLFVVRKTRAATREKAARTAAEARPRVPARPLPPRLRDESNRQLLARVPKEYDSQTSLILSNLLALKEREGRDNALIHYVVGGWSMPDRTRQSNDMETTISNVLKNGWGPDAEILRPYLAAWQPGFREIRKGASLNYARGIGFDQGITTPIPNYMAAQESAKALCLEGRLFESEGRTTEALANYVTVVTMGRDYTTTGSVLISHLIGYACESTGLRRIEQLVASDRLDQISLEALLARLKDIERSHGSAVEALGGEMEMQKSWLAQLKADPEAFHSETFGGEPATLWDLVVSHNEDTWRTFYQYQVNHYQFTHNLERVEPDLKALNDFHMKALQTPWSEFDAPQYTREWDKRVAESHPIFRDSPSLIEARVRYLTTLSRLRACQVSAAVMAWKKKHGALPASLTELRVEYFPNGLPIDPFSGKSFMYSVANGSQVRLAGVGPDKLVDGKGLQYDPTNGSISGGDIVSQP